ncbi:MAG TPA: response regulator [Candidatus Limnocylindrales bacterium]|nr:response regulator [Candidatus Limnocylindrales bacterium]
MQGKALRARIKDLEETLQAIRRGDVDALVINGPQGDQVFTLQGAEHPYRILVETINEGAATLDADGTVLYANARFAEMLDVPLEKFIGASVQSHVPEEQREKLHSLIERARRRSAKDEIHFETPGGRQRLVRLSLSPVKNPTIETICMVATDLSELAEASEALKANEHALRQLSARLLQLQDDERRRIARDLHDVTGQKLALQSIALSRILRTHTTASEEEMKDAVAECLDMSHQMSEEIRTLSYLLHPPLLDELGLSAAVKWYAQGFETRTGIHVEVDVTSDFARLSGDAEVTLFRIAQESLTNVHRYSGSTEAYVRIRANESEVRLEVGDFGKGMELGRVKASSTLAGLGVGIQGMRERMRQLDGTLEIMSQVNKGTVVVAMMPVRQLRPEISFEMGSNGETAGQLPKGDETDMDGRSLPKRILVADDHALLRHGVCTLLENEANWEVCGEAADGKEAVDKTVALKPDLVILDINMPVLNGLAAVGQILRQRPQTKILIFTVHESDQTLHEILAAGAHGYLSKGRAGRDLVDAVKTIFGGKSFYPAAATRA